MDSIVCRMTTYDEKSTTKKFQVKVAINYKDTGGQTSLSHQLIYFKARILCQVANGSDNPERYTSTINNPCGPQTED